MPNRERHLIMTKLLIFILVRMFYQPIPQQIILVFLKKIIVKTQRCESTTKLNISDLIFQPPAISLQHPDHGMNLDV